MSGTGSCSSFESLIQRLRLQNKPLVSSHQHSSVSSSVLICLFPVNNGEARVILTKRSSNLSTHSGEVALPGGKRDVGDADDVATALREAHEEIGLEPSLVNVLCVLDPLVTKRGLQVVPVIAELTNPKAFVPSPNPAEVEDIFDVPLDMFLKDEKRRVSERDHEGHKYLLQFFDYETEDERKFVIWALTAGILIRAASFVYQKPPDFVDSPPKFWYQNATL